MFAAAILYLIYVNFVKAPSIIPVVDGAGNVVGAIKDGIPASGSGSGSTNKTIKPRWARDKLVDLGYDWQPRGWYDMQNQGVRNDYCRHVGDGGPPGGWFSCSLAGSDQPYTANPYTGGGPLYDDSLPHDPL